MSYFGVSNPELNNPFYGIGAAKRGRARAQRKRFTHTQMAGRNGGFANPREIMAYHNKGELSDGATIQALSLFGIGAAGARKMISDSHRSKQQAAMMGARRQQAAFRSMGSHDGRPDNIRVLAYQDRNGGNWSIEINQVGAHIGVGTRCDWRIKSIDSDNPMYNVWVKSDKEANYNAAKATAQAAIEELVEDAPQDYVVDEFGENFQDALGNWWAIRYSTQYTGGVITWVNWTVSSVILNLSYTGQAETKAAARVAALDAVDAWAATQQAENDGGGDATGNGNGSNTGGNGMTYTPVDISNLNFATANAVRDAFLADSITYGQAAKYLQTHFSAYYYSQLEIDDFLLVEMDYSYTHPGFPKEDYDIIRHPVYGYTVATKYREETPSSTWSIITIKRGENQFSWAATSSNFPEANLRSEAFSTTSEAGKAEAMQYIDNSIENYHSSKPLLDYYTAGDDENGGNGTGQNGNGTGQNGTGTGQNGTGTGQNGTGTGQNGTGTGQNGTGTGTGVTIAEGYDNDTDVIDGYKLGVIDYREAHNTLVLQFGYSENEASEALRTESSSTDYDFPVTDGDSFRETGVDNTLPVQVQTQEIVPVPSGSSFIEENKVALAGGAILVAGAAAMAYSNRRN